MNQCHYSWYSPAYGWVRCVNPKGMEHGERHEHSDPRAWVAVSYELDFQPHRWVA